MSKSLLQRNHKGKQTGFNNKNMEFSFMLDQTAFKGTIVNRALPSLHEGLIEITLAGPLIGRS